MTNATSPCILNPHDHFFYMKRWDSTLSHTGVRAYGDQADPFFVEKRRKKCQNALSSASTHCTPIALWCNDWRRFYKKNPDAGSSAPPLPKTADGVGTQTRRFPSRCWWSSWKKLWESQFSSAARRFFEMWTSRCPMRSMITTTRCTAPNATDRRDELDVLFIQAQTSARVVVITGEVLG